MSTPAGWVALAAALAVAALVGVPPGRAAGRLAGQPVAEAAPAIHRAAGGRRRAVLVLLGALLAVLVVGVASGPQGAAYAAIGLVPALTAASLLKGRARELARARSEAEVARACSLVAAEVRAGRAPEGAVDLVAEDCPVLAPAAAALLVGDDVVRTWRHQAGRPGCGGLADLARAWEVSRACGAPMGPSLDQVAGALEREAEVSRLVRGELASAQATGRLMAVLPAVGIGLGYSIGGRPLDFLLHTAVGLACTVVAVALASLGTLWTTALARTPGREP
ncbi:hypothetical protein [Raineyella sp. W15-4]|uniref:hypothetical protein n=1 Tax=Raineyella sp. W15-4 TaxID=3081651 RepID=UPI002952D1B8|nr:hypothetical protein [Raineyella sp. W15-4]WOQ17624.1 hypothetical protein R0145_02615 [Raineyella sp. W15-4]